MNDSLYFLDPTTSAYYQRSLDRAVAREKDPQLTVDALPLKKPAAGV